MAPRSIAAAAAFLGTLLACTPSLADGHSFGPRERGSGLALLSPASGGLFAPGGTSTFRVLNASPSESLRGVGASATLSAGFKILKNACPAQLAPRASCELTVGWSPLAGSSAAKGTLVVRAGGLSVESALEGSSALLR